MNLDGSNLADSQSRFPVLKTRKSGLPIVEDLAAHDVPADAPAVLIALVAKPIMAQNLGIEVVRLKGRVVDVRPGTLEEEEAVMVYKVVSSVEPKKDGLVDSIVIVYELRRHLV
jgi:hypothetical protein